MKNHYLSIIVLLIAGAFLTISCDGQGSKNSGIADYNTVPLPNEIAAAEGEPFVLSKSTLVTYPAGNEKMQRNAEFLAEFLELSCGIRPDVAAEAGEAEAGEAEAGEAEAGEAEAGEAEAGEAEAGEAEAGKTETGKTEATKAAKGNTIVLSVGLQHENPEAYRIEVDAQSIRVDGASEAAVFFAIQTLRKATPVGNYRSVNFAPVTINDAPRFGHRGMMLDVSRHFQPVSFVKKFIDLLALHNLNRFHWHLTEDQGWRIEIESYPKLTEIGAYRNGTVIGRNTGEYDTIRHGGFYTKEELKEVVAYAAERYITIIPEVDLPGHMLAALAAYPELGCTGGPYEVAKEWGVFEDVLCPGNEATFTFLEAVLTEVMEIFPSEYIHIGGDEAPKVRWEKCPRCQARIKELKLRDRDGHTAEHYLQSYVTARVEKFLNEHGRRIIGWDEILEGELAPNATVMSWRGMGGGIQAAQMGHDVIMTPTTYCYFDYYQSRDTGQEPLAIGGYVPLSLVYSFDPVPETLTEEERTHILGAQANLWTEYVKTPEHVEYMTLPRLAAMCEVQWLQPEKKDYDQFLERLTRLFPLYDKMGYNYATHLFNVDAKLTANFNTNALDVEFSTIDNAPVYYTLDGTEPNKSSLPYKHKFSISEDAELRAVALREGKESRVFSEMIQVSKSSFKPIELLTSPDPNYTYGGAGMLVDALQGQNTNYRTGRWIGFQGNDLVAVIDMLQPTELSSLTVRNAVVTGDWIFDASRIALEASEDGTTYTLVAEETIADEHSDHWADIVVHSLSFEPATARYFKVTVQPTLMPKWHPGSGKNAFIFVDEIQLN